MNTESDNHIPSIEEIHRYLSRFAQVGGEKWQEEYDRYVDAHAHRFYETLKALPQSNPGENLLELGTSPCCMTLLLEHYSKYTLFLADGFRTGDPEHISTALKDNSSAEVHTFTYQTFNVEIDSFPYPDKSFDIVLCCELLEHLILNPTHMLLEIYRILKPGGRVLITTPNVLVLRNLVSLLKHRRNIYYPYSGYGVYGRHNREWTLEELVQFVEGCGYSIENAQIVDTYPHHGYSRWLKMLFPFFRDMLLVVGRADNEPRNYYPDNLYESLPIQYSLENPVPSRLQKP
jgi:SAM-dependent methyltransferase